MERQKIETGTKIILATVVGGGSALLGADVVLNQSLNNLSPHSVVASELGFKPSFHMLLGELVEAAPKNCTFTEIVSGTPGQTVSVYNNVNGHKGPLLSEIKVSSNDQGKGQITADCNSGVIMVSDLNPGREIRLKPLINGGIHPDTSWKVVSTPVIQKEPHVIKPQPTVVRVQPIEPESSQPSVPVVRVQPIEAQPPLGDGRRIDNFFSFPYRFLRSLGWNISPQDEDVVNVFGWSGGLFLGWRIGRRIIGLLGL